MIRKEETNVSVLNRMEYFDIEYIPGFLNIKENIKVKKAILSLNIRIGEGEHLVYYVDESSQSEILIDKLTRRDDHRNVSIDITDELEKALKESKDRIKLKITKRQEILEDYLGNARVNIWYVNRKSSSIERVKKTIDCKKAGELSVSISDGIVELSHQDLETGEKGTIVIGHHYLSDRESQEKIMSGYSVSNSASIGEKWKLSLEQYLIKEMDEEIYKNDKKSSAKYTYIDGKGEQVEFLDRYYYIKDGEKKYLKSTEVEARLNGTLKYIEQEKEYEVKKEVKSEEGIELINSIDETFKGSEYIIKEDEKIAQAKEELNVINNAIREYEVGLEYTRRSREALRKSSELLTKQIELDNLKQTLEKSELDVQNSYTDIIGFYNESNQNYRNASDARINAALLEEGNYQNEIDLKNLANSASDEVTGWSFNIRQDEITNQYSIYEKEKTILPISHAAQTRQLEAQVYKLDNDEENLEKILEEYKIKKVQKEYEIKELEKQIPAHYLLIEDTLLGFAKTEDEKVYRLVSIIGLDGNQTNVIYKEEKIEKVINSEEKETLFEYENGLLKSIKNEKNKKIRYEYNNGRLIKVIYPNNKVSEYEYNEKGLLIKIKNSNRNEWILEYDTLNKLTRIKEQTKIKKITSEGVEESQQEIIKSDTGIEYVNNKCVSVINNKTEEKETYLLNELGEVQTVYQGSFNEENRYPINIVSYQNKGNKKKISARSRKYAKELLEEIEYVGYPQNQTIGESYLGETELGITELISLDKANANIIDTKIYQTEDKLEKVIEGLELERIKQTKENYYILSGWSKADACYINRRSSDYSEDEKENIRIEEDEFTELMELGCDVNKQNRRYELRAELTYLKGTEIIEKEEYASFDYRNQNWQYCALPIRIQEDEQTSLIRMKLIFDYTNNTGSAKIFNMSLKQGEWEYEEYNEDDKIVYYKDNETEKRYEYEDKKLVKETEKSNDGEIIKEYKYNELDKLVRTNTSDGLIEENEYDETGKLISTYVYNKKDPTRRKYTYEIKVDEKGNNIELNQFGKEIEDKEIVYGYDEEENLISIRQDDNGNIYEYKEGLITKLTHNKMDYEFEYDGLQRNTKIKIANEEYLQTSYQDIVDEGKIKGVKVTNSYANGDTYISYLDNEDKVSKTEYQKENGEKETLIENIYDSAGVLINQKDIQNNIETSYTYDEKGNEIKKKRKIGNKEWELEKQLDEKDKLIKNIFRYNNNNRETNYQYQKDKFSLIELANGTTQEIYYDDLDRVDIIKQAGNIIEYDYLTIANHTCQLIEKESHIINDKEETTRYEYDKEGRIVKIYENDEEIRRFKYDKLSRIVQEDNKRQNTTTVYEYNKGGNITSRKEYKYSPGVDISTLEQQKIYNYQYLSLNNRDQLLAYEKEKCVYDKLGNPIVYRDKNLLWDKGSLINYSDIASYRYDASGLRTSKTIGEITTNYYYNNGALLAQDNGNVLFFDYGIDGINGFTYQGVGNYRYKKNVLGDILGIIDDNNEEIVRYYYDAYGNVTTYVKNGEEFVNIKNDNTYTSNGENNKFIAKLNPFRYRGYYYDEETNLYYLISRYYDPETGRFISMDNVKNLNKDTINGLNLYAYCLNDPINNVDPEGTWNKKWWINILIGLGFILIGAIVFKILGGKTVSFIKSILTGINTAAMSGLMSVGFGLAGYVFGISKSSLEDYSIAELVSNFADILISSFSAGFLWGAFCHMVSKILVAYSRTERAQRPFGEDVDEKVRFFYGGSHNSLTIVSNANFRIDVSLYEGVHYHQAIRVGGKLIRGKGAHVRGYIKEIFTAIGAYYSHIRAYYYQKNTH